MNLFHEGINSLVDFICYDALKCKIQYKEFTGNGTTIGVSFNFVPSAFIISARYSRGGDTVLPTLIYIFSSILTTTSTFYEFYQGNSYEYIAYLYKSSDGKTLYITKDNGQINTSGLKYFVIGIAA